MHVPLGHMAVGQKCRLHWQQQQQYPKQQTTRRQPPRNSATHFPRGTKSTFTHTYTHPAVNTRSSESLNNRPLVVSHYLIHTTSSRVGGAVRVPLWPRVRRRRHGMSQYNESNKRAAKTKKQAVGILRQVKLFNPIKKLT